MALDIEGVRPAAISRGDPDIVAGMSPVGLFPRGGPRPTTSHAEQAMYRALGKGLPGGWTAWHSLRVRTRTGWEGEGDFVVAIPDRGILVIEVKGGVIEVADGQWIQNGQVMRASPRDQAQSFVRKLGTKLRERGVREHVPFAICTAFPETPFSNAPTHGDLEGAVLGQQDLPYLGDALGEMRGRHFDARKIPPGARWIEALHAMWGESWTPRLRLGHRVELRADELVPLDEEQLAYLDLIDENERVLIRGGPGTGKTLLAREMWVRLRARGLRPVFLCFTNALAAAVRATEVAQAFTVRELAIDLLAELGVKEGAPQAEWPAETWEQASALAATSAGPLARGRHDAVVVDEAQDLSPSDWDLVLAIADGRPMYGFADEGQAFWPDRSVPKEAFATLFTLKRRYRCPEPLARFADLYRREEGGPGDRSRPAPIDELRLVRLVSETDLEAEVAREIRRALDDGVEAGDIAVVSLAGQTKTALCARDRIGDIPVRRADAAGSGGHVVADTFLRFKGLERPWIIVVELGLGTTRYDLRMHVALTRATVGCVVVATDAEIARDPRIGACRAAASPAGPGR
jgi:hypothetical protein